jgi:hypothetical protein
MFGVGLFLAGFGAGWVVRGTVESSRAVFVKAVAGAMGAADRVQRAIAMEREHLEDFYAEARTLFEQNRARRNSTTVETEPNNDRAAA